MPACKLPAASLEISCRTGCDGWELGNSVEATNSHDGAQYQQVVPMLRGLSVGGEKRIISEHSHITEPAGNTPSADKVCQRRLLRTLTWTSSQIGRWQRVGQVWAIHFGFPQRSPGLSAMLSLSLQSSASMSCASPRLVHAPLLCFFLLV